MVKQVLIIFGCLLIGNLFVELTGFKLPASIVGLFTLLVLLMSGVVKPKDVKDVGNFFDRVSGPEGPYLNATLHYNATRHTARYLKKPDRVSGAKRLY